MKIRYGFLAMLLFFAVNLFALKVTYDYDRAFDFSKVKTYQWIELKDSCLLYTSPSPRDYAASRMPSSA